MASRRAKRTKSFGIRRKSVAGMATDLTLNYANFAPVNVWNFAPYSVLCYTNFSSLKCFEQ